MVPKRFDGLVTQSPAYFAQQVVALFGDVFGEPSRQDRPSNSASQSIAMASPHEFTDGIQNVEVGVQQAVPASQASISARRLLRSARLSHADSDTGTS
jgi:hypothetical protein